MYEYDFDAQSHAEEEYKFSHKKKCFLEKIFTKNEKKTPVLCDFCDSKISYRCKNSETNIFVFRTLDNIKKLIFRIFAPVGNF